MYALCIEMGKRVNNNKTGKSAKMAGTGTERTREPLSHIRRYMRPTMAHCVHRALDAMNLATHSLEPQQRSPINITLDIWEADVSSFRCFDINPDRSEHIPMHAAFFIDLNRFERTRSISSQTVRLRKVVARAPSTGTVS